MTTHVFQRTLVLGLPRSEVFPFFAAAENLARITPPALGFRIRTPLPVLMRQGAVIDYTIRLARLPVRWRTIITVWDPPNEFVDEQARGPYALWIHRHRFRDVEGGTEIEDRVSYALPLGPLGRLLHPVVRRQLRTIFAYRERAVRRLLDPQLP